MTSEWLDNLAIASLAIAVACAIAIVLDIAAGRRQHMAIMNIVWPITALYAGLLGLWAYFWIGRADKPAVPERGGTMAHASAHAPTWKSAGLAATHCGSGCTIGDLLGEGVLMPLLPLTLFGHRIFAAWSVDFVLAFAIGIAFQYFSIASMKRLPPAQILVQALKADTLSLTAWQVGMYGWMAIATFAIFGHELDASGPVFWFMMQLAMLAGFATSYPANWWLVKSGIKEAMH